MRKIFFSLSALLMAGTMMLSAQSYELRVLTFEDTDVKTGFESLVDDISTWSDLIDDPQQYGQLLYGDNNQGAEVPYSWTDGGNTELHHEFIEGWSPGYYAFYSGGEAISHYWSSDFTTYGDFMSQLTLYRPDLASNEMNTEGGGHNGSDNFCVHFGYIDNTGWGLSYVPGITFDDGVARVIDHVYVCMTTYSYYCITNGNDLSAALGADGKVWLQARGFASANDDEPTSTVELLFADGTGYAVLDWTKWDLYELGEIEKLEFNIYGEGIGSANGYGFSQPAYFAWDDMAVRFPKATPDPEPEPEAENQGIAAHADNTGAYYSTFFDSSVKYALPAGVEAYVATIGDDALNLTKIAGAGQTIPANNAVILKSTVQNYTLTVSDAAAVSVTANSLQGTDAAIANPGNCYVLSGVDGVVGFYRYTGTLGAHKAYVIFNGAGAPKRLRFVYDEEQTATGLEENMSAKYGESQKFIENGQLYIIRDGVRYNAQGQMMK